jgi:hypothetical protein
VEQAKKGEHKKQKTKKLTDLVKGRVVDKRKCEPGCKESASLERIRMQRADAAT